MIEVNWCQPPNIFESANSSTECSGNFGYLLLIMNFRTFRGHKSIRKNRLITWKELKAGEIKSNVVLDQNRETCSHFDPLSFQKCYGPYKKVDQKLVLMGVSDIQFHILVPRDPRTSRYFRTGKMKFWDGTRTNKNHRNENMDPCLSLFLQTFQIKPYCHRHYLMLLNSNSIFYAFYVWTHPFNVNHFPKCDFLFK